MNTNSSDRSSQSVGVLPAVTEGASDDMQINGEPATAHSILAALVDIHDDEVSAPPEHRCYVPSAYSDTLDMARRFLAAPAAAVPESELIRASNAGYAQGLIDGKALAAVGASPEKWSPDAKTWAAYVAGMIETYLNFDESKLSYANPNKGREAAIAGIIERRMWSGPAVGASERAAKLDAHCVYCAGHPDPALRHAKHLAYLWATSARDTQRWQDLYEATERAIDALAAVGASVQPVPVAYSEGRTLHWHVGRGITDAQLYAGPVQPVQASQIEPTVVKMGTLEWTERYYLSATIAGEKFEREVTLDEFLKAEQAAGFRSKFPGRPATGGFGSGSNGGRVAYVTPTKGGAS